MACSPDAGLRHIITKKLIVVCAYPAIFLVPERKQHSRQQQHYDGSYIAGNIAECKRILETRRNATHTAVINIAGISVMIYGFDLRARYTVSAQSVNTASV